MRRIRKVHIFVSDNFHRFLEDNKRQYDDMVMKNTGIRKTIGMTNFTDIIANSKVIFPKIKIGGKSVQSKKGRRI